MNRPAVCRGCGDTVDIDFGADRGSDHGGITNFHGGTTVFCYRTNQWEPTDRLDREDIRRRLRFEDDPNAEVIAQLAKLLDDDTANQRLLDAGLGDAQRRINALLGELVERASADIMAGIEEHALGLIYRTLRPRLRWAARRPRALRLLIALRLWEPPQVSSLEAEAMQLLRESKADAAVRFLMGPA